MVDQYDSEMMVESMMIEIDWLMINDDWITMGRWAVPDLERFRPSSPWSPTSFEGTGAMMAGSMAGAQ